MSVEIPKMALAFGQYAIPQADVIECRVHLGCTKEVSSFELTLQNWNGKYSPGGSHPLNVGMDGHIDIGRGSNVPQIITCRIESIKYESSPTENYVRVSGRCWGERLFRRVFTGTFENMKGEAIIKYLLDYYVGLSHTRGGTELVEDTDTTYSRLEYQDTPVWDIIKYIAESADKQGVIGFDFRIAPDGKFEFFPKNSKTSPVSLSEKIEAYEYRKDIHRIRNKIMVYGLADKSVPLDKDAWTENLSCSDGSWTASAGEVSSDPYFKARGTASIRVYATNLYYAGAIFTLNSGKEVNTNLYPILSFMVWLERAFSGNIAVQLIDASNRTATKNLTAAPGEWRKIDLKVGSLYAEDWEWVDQGFDWKQIKKVRVDAHFPGVGSGSFWIDQLYFGGRRYSAVREDTSSQNAYGLRELTETDEELISDNECDLRARALLDYLKGPAEYLRISTTVLDYGNTPLLPGDKIHVTLPNEGVDSDFRIETVEYFVDAKTQTLEITLELGKVPPLLADYLYGLRSTTVTVEKLARTKLGKKGLPSPFAAGGGLGSHHSGHEAGDELGNQWTDPNVGGWDKITGWISPKHIGPFSDEPEIIKFRTRNKAGDQSLNHQFRPTDNEYGVLGSEQYHWKELHSKFLVLYHGQQAPYGDLRIKVQDEANPKARLTEELLEFGPGADRAADVHIKRVDDDTLELKAWYLKPHADNILELGASDKKIKLAYIASLLLPSDGYLHIMAYEEENPRARLTQDSLAFGPGGSSAPDTWLKRIGANMLECSGDIIPDFTQARQLGSAEKMWNDVWTEKVHVGDYLAIPSDGTLYMDEGSKVVGSFIPHIDNSYNLGNSTKRWKEIHAVELHVSNMLFNSHLTPEVDNSYDIGVGGEQPKRWRDLYLAGAIKALDGGVAVNLLPDQTGVRDLGSAQKAWDDVWAMKVHVGDNLHILEGCALFMDSGSLVRGSLTPDTDGAYDLGSSTKKWSNLYVNGLGRVGWLNIGDYTVITQNRVLQNVSADANIISSGQFPLARLPRGTAGYVLEAQGPNYDPTYVNPNGRYQPASHNHSGETISPSTVNCNYVNAAVKIVGASFGNLFPEACDTGVVGTTLTYWNCIAGNSVWYKALGQFDALDDLALIKRIKGNGKVDERGMPLADPESLPPEVTENGLINAGALTGLLIGAIKQLAAKVEALEKRLVTESFGS
ncbi:MAG: hypothetical protein QXE74_08190 [Candidatus Bathyarchaeia archaeon]